MNNTNYMNYKNIVNSNNMYSSDENDYLCSCYDKINDILGENFEFRWMYDEKELKNKKILNFKFINYSGIKNIEKNNYINRKIELLKLNNFIEIEDLKISGMGRFIKIHLKTISDYEKEKILLLEEFTNKIKFIDEKINILRMGFN